MTKLFRLLLVATWFPTVLCPPALAQKSGSPDPNAAFSSFDPNDPNVTSQLKKDGVTVFINYSNKAIWHSDRMGDHSVREEFVGATTFPVKDEVKGGKIVSALIHAVELCRQAKPVKPNP